MKKQIITLFIPGILLMGACKKEKCKCTMSDPPAGIQPHLTRLEQDANNYLVLGYNSDRLLNLFRLVEENVPQEAHFGYNAAKKPTSGTIGPYEMGFTYSAGILDKITFTSATPDPQHPDHYLKFTYSDGRVAQTVDYFNLGTSYLPANKHVYAYYANGDIKSVTSYSLSALPEQYDQEERTEYEYDTKVNPIQPADEVMYALYLPKAVHNITKETTFDGGNHLQETRSYSYNYNGFSMPTGGVENITYPNRPSVNHNIKYQYQ